VGVFCGLSARPGFLRRENALHRARQPLENGYNLSFNSKLRDELLNGEIFTTLYEARVLIERWRRHYNGAGGRMAAVLLSWRGFPEWLHRPIRY